VRNPDDLDKLLSMSPVISKSKHRISGHGELLDPDIFDKNIEK
jgi:hypothetical protein